jgi:hypothetical protein
LKQNVEVGAACTLVAHIVAMHWLIDCWRFMMANEVVAFDDRFAVYNGMTHAVMVN